MEGIFGVSQSPFDSSSQLRRMIYGTSKSQ